MKKILKNLLIFLLNREIKKYELEQHNCRLQFSFNAFGSIYVFEDYQELAEQLQSELKKIEDKIILIKKFIKDCNSI